MKNRKYKKAKVFQLPPLTRIKCPNCNKIGDYETNNNLETYCTHCGLIIDSAYPYSAGVRFWLLYDEKYYKIGD